MKQPNPRTEPKQRTQTSGMSRRGALAGAGAALTTSLVGCLGMGLFDDSPGAHEDVVLEVPTDYDALKDAPIDYPIHGEAVPDATVPDVVTGEEISPRDFIGERHTMSTFIFTRCPGACPALTSNLLQVQATAAKNEFSDDIALLEYTFDPEYDTEELFQEYADNMGIDLGIGNWHFLRPETEAHAEEVVTDTFGVWYGRLSDEQREDMDMHEDMAFQHENLILLVNKAGYVERAYHGNPPNPGTVVDDVNTLIDRW